jgi:beta-lactam-binding protein with PASTA domain
MEAPRSRPRRARPQGLLVALLLAALLGCPAPLEGQRPDTVPRVVDRPLPEAVEILAAHDIEVDSVVPVPSDAREGVVVDQRPAPGAPVGRIRLARLWVSTGPPPPPPPPEEVRVPSVVERTRPEALELLAARELVGRVVDRREADLERGRVIEQRPGPGRWVAAGSVVELVLSLGPAAPAPTPPPDPARPPPRTPPEPPRVEVPELVGLEVDRAEWAARARGLVLAPRTATAADVAPRTVRGQRPPAGTRVPPGSTVEVDVAPAPATSIPAWIIGGGALLLAALGILQRRWRSRRAARQPAAPSHAPVVRPAAVAFHPRPGPVRQQVSAGPVVADLTVRLEPRPLPPPGIQLRPGVPLPAPGGRHG